MEYAGAINAFVEKQRKLLALEHKAKKTEYAEDIKRCTVKELELKGTAIRKLKFTNISTGLYGKALIHLESARLEKISEYDQLDIDYTKYVTQDEVVLPPTVIMAGDTVGIFKLGDQLSEPLMQGTVYSQTSQELVVALSKPLSLPLQSLTETNLIVLKLANEAKHKQYMELLEQILNSKETPTHLWETFFKLRQPRKKAEMTDIVPYNLHLSELQIQIVQKALMAIDIHLINGPPATGKTSIIVECILQEVTKGGRVLVFGLTERALDMIANKIMPGLSKKIKVCRLSHSTQIALDALINASEEGVVAKKYKEQLNELLRGFVDATGKEQIAIEVKNLKKEIKKLEVQAIETIVDTSNIILSTSTGLREIMKFLHNRKYIVIIDDASLLTEPLTLIPMQLASKIILAGDVVQLTPDVKSEQAIKGGLTISLFEKLQTFYPEATSSLLLQYRMNNNITTLVSESLYHNHLKAADLVSLASLKKKKKTALDKLKDEITDVRKIIDRNLLLIDTNGSQYGESSTTEESKFNVGYDLS